MILKTERLTIRHIVADDWKSIKEIWVDCNASAPSQYDIPHNTDDEDVQRRITKWAAANSGTEHMFLLFALMIPLSDTVPLILGRMDMRSAIVSTQHITAKATQRKATWHSLIICVSLVSQG